MDGLDGWSQIESELQICISSHIESEVQNFISFHLVSFRKAKANAIFLFRLIQVGI